MLKKLNAERDLYETRMTVIDSDVFEECAGSEIVEHWNEEQIDEWKSNRFVPLNAAYKQSSEFLLQRNTGRGRGRTTRN